MFGIGKKQIVLGIVLTLLILLAIVVVQAKSSEGQAELQPKIGVQAALGTVFTYQGQLKSKDKLVNDSCSMAFRLYDQAANGNQIGDAITTTVPISDGLFIVSLDFGGDAFAGDGRWLGIKVKCPTDGSYADLGRQELTAAPYALYSRSTGALQGNPVTTTVPAMGQVLEWDGSTWTPATDDGITYTAGSGLRLSGTEFSVKGSAYANVIIVAKNGGDFASIQSALDSISDNSASNRYLVWVAPGTYTETVTMKEYVDIEGAGELLTKITAPGSASANTGTVMGANNAELRFLTVENTGGSTYAIAVSCISTSPQLTHIAAASSGSDWNYGIGTASSLSKMTDVTATASGGTYSWGISNSFSSPMMSNVTASASGASNINWGVQNTTGSSPKMIEVTASGSGGDDNCGVVNASSSPMMVNVIASGLDGRITNCGVSNSSSSPTMINVTASASGGDGTNFGVHNYISSPTIRNSTLSAIGGSSNYGLYNSSSSPTIYNSTLSAIGGGSNYGIFNIATNDAYTVKVNNCQVTGSTNTVYSDSEFATLIGASLLDGGTVWANGGIVTCAGVYDESYAFFASTCP